MQCRNLKTTWAPHPGRSEGWSPVEPIIETLSSQARPAREGSVFQSPIANLKSQIRGACPTFARLWQMWGTLKSEVGRMAETWATSRSDIPVPVPLSVSEGSAQYGSTAQRHVTWFFSKQNKITKFDHCMKSSAYNLSFSASQQIWAT